MSDMDFDTRLMRYLDGAMGEAELVSFDAELAGDKAKRAALVTAAMHGRLIASRVATQVPSEWGAKVDAPIAVLTPMGRQSIGRIGFLVAAIAAALVIAGVAAAVYMTLADGTDQPERLSPRRTVAVLIDAGDAEWNSTPIGGGQDLTAGPIDIAGGTIDLDMRGGASVKLTGPVRATLVSADRIRIDRGTLNARVDGGGFSVDVPGDVRVTDIGTAFAVDVADDGRATVRVTEGRVRIDRIAEAEALTAAVDMVAGEWSVVNADRYGEPLRIVCDLPVVNASFEDDGRNMAGGPLPRGWRSVIPERAGCEDHVTNGNFQAGVNGRFVGLANYRLTGDPKGAVSALVQDTDHRVEPGVTYELAVAVGQRIDQRRKGVPRTLWELSLLDADTGQTLAQIRGESAEAGVMIDQVLTYTPSPDHAGRRLAIHLANPQDQDTGEPSPGQTNFDHVRLSKNKIVAAPAPESRQNDDR